jgi:biopolymer transport protein ExbD
MRGHHSGGSSNPDINLTPLLDLVFQLIMFFMITVNFVQAESSNEDVLLPVAQAASALDQGAEDYIFLNLNKEGKLVGFKRELNNDAKLRAYLQKEHNDRDRIAREKGRPGANIVVVLRAHRDARYYQVWHVLDMCSKAGYDRWQMRVEWQK